MNNNQRKLKKAATGVLAVLTALLMIPGNLSSVEAGESARNTTFTTMADMQTKLGTHDNTTWSPVYLTEAENYYWTFCDQSALGGTDISINVAKNAYRNLEMLLDDGYTMDYQTLSSYCTEYLGKVKGKPDAFYNVLKSCLSNPYLLNKPAATVTATTYNGKDYSQVFDAQYYFQHNPDLQKSIGNNPAELLRHFVESGISEGRQGNASFDVKAYAVQVDAEVMKSMKASSAYKALGTGKQDPLGKYSYSLANYYGKYLNHYAAADASSEDSTTQISSSDPISADIKNTSGNYTETSTKSVYTNEAVSSTLANQRPIAVMMPTDTQAQPSYGIGSAVVLYEMMEEGDISRQMAVIQDWTGLSRIGNIRSCRLYYTFAAKEWDPVLIHFGGVAYMKGTIDASDINNLSGTYEYGTGGKAPGAGYFFRTTDRVAPHNAYISAAGIQKASKQLGYQLTLRQGYYNNKHFNFTDTVNTLSDYGNAGTANTIDLSKVFTYTKSKLVYNASAGVYEKYIHGKAQVDAANGKQISFTNVIVQDTKWQKLDKKGYLGFQMIDSTEDGYYFTKGKEIHITWKKTSDYSPTRYYDDNGNEIKMNTGKTYIAIAQKGRSVQFN